MLNGCHKRTQNNENTNDRDRERTFAWASTSIAVLEITTSKYKKLTLTKNEKNRCKHRSEQVKSGYWIYIFEAIYEALDITTYQTHLGILASEDCQS